MGRWCRVLGPAWLLVPVFGAAACGSSDGAKAPSHAPPRGDDSGSGVLDGGDSIQNPQTDARVPTDASTRACFIACGGDPSGLWRLDSKCFVDLTGGCSHGVASIGFTSDSPDGLFYFYGNRVSFHLAYTDHLRVHYTAACATSTSSKIPSPTNCESLATAVTNGPPTPGTTSTSGCTYAPGACDCTLDATTDYTATSATLTLAGNVLTYQTPDFQESLEYCVSGDTLSFRPTTARDVGMDLTYVFHRETPVCQAATTGCDGDTVYQCDEFGTSRSVVRKCNPGELCIGAACMAPVCTPDAPSCDGTVSTTCNAIGSGYTGARDDCGSRGLSCAPGAGCLNAVTYDTGDTMFCFDSPNPVGHVIGNFYVATVNTRLVEFAPYMTVPAATTGTFLVYEAAAGGPFVNVLRVHRALTAGQDYQSSGAINVPIVAGREYGMFVIPDGPVKPCDAQNGPSFLGLGYYEGNWFGVDPKTSSGDSFTATPGSGSRYRQRLTVAAPSDAGSGPSGPPDASAEAGP